MATRCYAAATTVVVSSRARAPRLSSSSHLPSARPSGAWTTTRACSGSYRRATVRAMGASPSSPSPSGQAPGACFAFYFTLITIPFPVIISSMPVCIICLRLLPLILRARWCCVLDLKQYFMTHCRIGLVEGIGEFALRLVQLPT